MTATDVDPAYGRARKAMRFVLQHPGEVVAPVVVSAIALVTLLDVLTEIDLSTTTLSKMAVFALCALVIGQLATQMQRRKLASEARDTLKEIVAAQRGVEQSLASLTRLAQAYELNVVDRGQQLDDLLANTATWRFRGGSGRWQRSTVLPTLSRNTTFDISYVMQIVDPRNRELCNRYANYRSLQRIAQGGERDGAPEDVRADLLACVYAAAWYSTRSRIKAEVSLLRTYGPLRFDVGSEGLVITVADPFAPALYARRGGWLFNAMVDEIQRSHDELPRLHFPRTPSLFPAEFRDVNGKHVRDALLATHVRSEDGYLAHFLDQSDDADFEDVARRCFRGRNDQR
jgi:hypothetical protein